MSAKDDRGGGRQGFTFFRSFRDAIKMTPPKDQLVLYKAIADYALDRIEPDISKLSTAGRICWTALRPNIDSGIVRYLNGCKGGAPKGNSNARKTTKKQPAINRKTTKPLLNKNENKNIEKNEEGSNKGRKTHITFIVPAKREIEDYISSAGLNVDASQFIDHYTANGWMMGRNKMRDWQAALRNWARRDYPTNTQKQPNNETHSIYQAL